MIFRLISATILTGIISGFFIVFYENLISFFTYIVFWGHTIETIKELPTLYLYLAPTISILIVNYLISYDKNIREYGINEIAESIIANNMVLKLKTLFLKVIASSLSLASGFLVGTEGPSAGIGAMIAYQMHKLFKLPQMMVKTIISIGASSGIAAVFVSPLTGISFAIENIAHQFIRQYVSYIILSSVIAFSISVNFFDSISFHYCIGRNIDYDYIIANTLFIPFITLFVFFYLFMKKKLLHFIDLELFKKFHKYRNIIFSLIGGSIVGTILLLEPHAAFSGKEIVIKLINQDVHIPLIFILSIILLRIIGTTISIYANAVGGIFLPLMSIGALVGYAYGEILFMYHFQIEPYYFAAIGAAVFMGVVMKLPLTAVVLAIETTFDYNVVISAGVDVALVAYLTSLYFDIKQRNVTKADSIVTSATDKS
jgi:CIC family chloride channel protein